MALKERTNEKEIPINSNAGNFKYTQFAITKHPHFIIKNEIQVPDHNDDDSQSILLELESVKITMFTTTSFVNRLPDLSNEF